MASSTCKVCVVPRLVRRHCYVHLAHHLGSCSTGLGRALAEAHRSRPQRRRHGARRRESRRPGRHRNAACAPVALDVTKPDQVTAALRADVDFGGIDVLVNNAGYGYRAAVEEGDDAEVRTLFETHFFGTVAMIKAVLPDMRARRSGAIVNISSIGATVTPVGSGYYGSQSRSRA